MSLDQWDLAGTENHIDSSQLTVGSPVDRPSLRVERIQCKVTLRLEGVVKEVAGQRARDGLDANAQSVGHFHPLAHREVGPLRLKGSHHLVHPRRRVQETLVVKLDVADRSRGVRTLSKDAGQRALERVLHLLAPGHGVLDPCPLLGQVKDTDLPSGELVRSRAYLLVLLEHLLEPCLGGLAVRVLLRLADSGDQLEN